MVANRLSDPSSKRRCVTDWLGADAALPEGRSAPSLDRLYRALDAVADAKDEIEAHCFTELCNLANLDLRLVCYDLTSTYFEGEEKTSARFPSKAFGYSRDHRWDRPQIVIGLLVTSDGIPIAHHVFSGNTADRSTLARGDGRSPGPLRGRAHRPCRRQRPHLRREPRPCRKRTASTTCWRRAFTGTRQSPRSWRLPPANRPSSCLSETTGPKRPRSSMSHAAMSWSTLPAVTCETTPGAKSSWRATEDGLIALAERVRKGRLVDPAKIGAAADRILRDSGVSRCFSTKITHGVFTWDYDEKAMDYEEKLLAGRYVITTSLDKKTASTAQVVAHYKALQSVERRFRVLKDFLALRPVFHYTEKRVRGHVAICVLAAVIEAVMALDLAGAKITDPDLEGQQLSARRALRELERIRMIRFVDANDNERQVITRPGPFQAKILAAFGVDTSAWRSRVA